jgi:hypothetical protein
MIDGNGDPHHRQSEGSLGTCQNRHLITRRKSRPVPEPTRHGHHPSTGGTPSSRGACASDEPRAIARNGRDLCPVR